MKVEVIALVEELAGKNVVDIQSDTTTSGVYQVDARDKSGIKDTKDRRPDSECYRCREKHEASSSRFKDAQCFKCGRRERLAKVCCGEKSQQKTGKGTDSGSGKVNKRARETASQQRGRRSSLQI